MSNNKLLNYQNINTDKYEYLEPVKASNCYMSSCVYNIDGSNRLPYYFQTPRLHTPTGIYKIRNEYKMDLIIPVDSPFLEYLINEDDKNIQITSDNSQEWFDEHFTNQEVSDKYKTSLIFRQGGEDPILRVNIPSYRGNPKCEVFDVKGKECDWSAVQPESQLIGILEKIGIKFYKEVLTGEYELHKIKVYNHAEQSKLPKGYLFQDEESEDESEDEDEVYNAGADEGDEDGENTEDEEDAMLRALRGDDIDDENDSDEDDSDEDDSDDDDDSDLEGLDLEGLEELDLTDLSDAEDDNDDKEEMSELASLENELEEVSMNDNGDGDVQTDEGDVQADEGDSEDEEEIITLEEVNTIPARNLDTFDDLNDDMLNLEEGESDAESEPEITDVPDELLSDMEQELEGGHEEELQNDGEADEFQIDELTDDELELNLSDDDSEPESEPESEPNQEEEQTFQTEYPELDGIDLSDLEETDLRTEIQADIEQKGNRGVEPEELTDEELEFDL
jgi:hypothetical protein